MSKKLAEGVDALVLDVKVGSGAFMKKQVDARRLAQTMVGIGRRMDKKVQALITDMNQPLGYAIGNALEVMEASQTLQNAGPADLTKLSIELKEEDGLPVEYLRQGFLSLSNPTKQLERLVLSKKLRHGGNPILRWKRFRGAGYYNVQLFRGSKRIYAAWPGTHQLGLSATWKWSNHRFRLTPGRYRWYVWAGLGARTLARYSTLGSASFVVPRP